MKVGIIGTGNMGKALAGLISRSGHEVLLGSREPTKSAAEAAKIGPEVRGGSNADAAGFGEIVILATPFGDATKEALSSVKSLAGKILIDITNPLTPDYMGLTIGHTTSAAEQVAALAPGAKVVKAFNHIFSPLLQQGATFAGGKPAAFYCGDDAAAKSAVAGLVGSLGFDPIDVGPLQAARFLEPTAEVMIRLAFAQGMGGQIALSLLRR